MSVKLNPCLSFPATAREAMTHYRQVLGGTLEMNTFAEYGAADEPFADQIMHASLVTPTRSRRARRTARGGGAPY